MKSTDTTARDASRQIPASAGIGLRFSHHLPVIDTRPDVAWIEVHTENYMGGGRAPDYLDTIRRDYPVSLHGVGLSLGSAEGLDAAHLARVRSVVDRFEPGLVSEHLSWSISGGNYLADLLPLPMTEEALSVVCRHVDQVQTHLKRRILVENPSTYLGFIHSTIPEWEFLAHVAQRTGCGILCDVNNIYVSASNHGWDATGYLNALPPSAIGEIHLAGHSVRDAGNGQTICIDDHGSRVCPAVWELYRFALERFGPVPTLIEWDTDVPPLEILMDEAMTAQAILERPGYESAQPNAA
ncbi:MNIO family bufferin maturase [Paraburkholderia caledonica]